MKKIIVVLLVGLMVFGSFTAVFAEEAKAVKKEARTSELKQEQKAERLEAVKAFTDKLHQINASRIERNKLQIQVIDKQDLLLDLYLNAKASGDKELLEAAKEERNQIQGINQEVKALHNQAKAAKEAFEAAKKNKDMDAARASLENLMEIHSNINNKIKEKLEVLGSVIDILS